MKDEIYVKSLRQFKSIVKKTCLETPFKKISLNWNVTNLSESDQDKAIYWVQTVCKDTVKKWRKAIKK